MFGGGTTEAPIRIEPWFENKDVGIQEETPLVLTIENTTQTSEVTSSLFQPKQMVHQLDQLIAYTRNLREETGVSHKDAMKEMQDFYDTRTKIRQIRSRIKKIKQGRESDEDVSEIKKLWDEMTTSINSFEGGLHKNEIATNSAKSDESVVLEKDTKFSERLLLRNDWKQKKQQFETENATYLQSEKERRESQTKIGSIKEKFAFWKKENKPASLLLSEQSYQLARKEYAQQLHTAMRERTIKAHGVYDVKGIVETEQNIDTAFANRFVLKAAHDKAKQEEMFVPEGKRSQMLLGMREGLRKHSRAIKYGSIFATTGIAIVSGGFFAGANALLGRTISMKLAAGGAVAGSYLGAYIGSAITQNRENKRNVSMRKAQKGFDVSRIEQFEADYFKNYKAFERAASNERKYAIGGAVIGGLAGSALGGNLDISEALEKNSYEGLGSVNEYIGQKDFHESNTAKPETILKTQYNTVGSMNEYLSPTDPHELSMRKTETEGKILDRMVQTEKGDLPPKVDRDHLIKDIEKVLETEPPQSEEVIVEQTPDIHYTFTPGDKINTVSEALCSLIEQNPALIHGDQTTAEALRDFHHEIEHLKTENPDAYEDLLDQMGITSGSIDEVGAGKTYNFAPLFEYLNNLPE